MHKTLWSESSRVNILLTQFISWLPGASPANAHYLGFLSVKVENCNRAVCLLSVLANQLNIMPPTQPFPPIPAPRYSHTWYTLDSKSAVNPPQLNPPPHFPLMIPPEFPLSSDWGFTCNVCWSSRDFGLRAMGTVPSFHHLCSLGG